MKGYDLRCLLILVCGLKWQFSILIAIIEYHHYHHKKRYILVLMEQLLSTCFVNRIIF